MTDPDEVLETKIDQYNAKDNYLFIASVVGAIFNLAAPIVIVRNIDAKKKKLSESESYNFFIKVIVFNSYTIWLKRKM